MPAISLSTRLRLAWQALFGPQGPGLDMAARLLRQREESRAILDKIARAVLLGDLDAAKRISAIGLDSGAIGGNLETWEAARNFLAQSPLPPPKSQPAPVDISEKLVKAAEKQSKRQSVDSLK